MAREKANFRETVADLSEKNGGKVELGVNDVKRIMGVGYNRAIAYMDGKKKITIYQLANKLLQEDVKNDISLHGRWRTQDG